MVTVEHDGSLVFRVYLPHAESVELVADFTDWGTGRVALRREIPEPCFVSEGKGAADEIDCGSSGEESPDHESPPCGEFGEGEPGWWSVRVRAPDGDHAFSYLIDDQWWLPDYAAHGVKRNEEGHWTSLLFVPPRPRLQERLTARRSFALGARRSA